MTIFLDHCVHKDLITSLKEAGYQVITAAEAKLDHATDTDIFDYCITRDCILLTFDKDFGNILRFNIRTSPGVVITYIEHMTKEEIINRTFQFFQKFNPDRIK